MALPVRLCFIICFVSNSPEYICCPLILFSCKFWLHFSSMFFSCREWLNFLFIPVSSSFTPNNSPNLFIILQTWLSKQLCLWILIVAILNLSFAVFLTWIYAISHYLASLQKVAKYLSETKYDSIILLHLITHKIIWESFILTWKALILGPSSCSPHPLS